MRFHCATGLVVLSIWSGITAHLRGDVVYGVLNTKIQSRKSVSFYPLIWAISQLNRITTVVWHVLYCESTDLFSFNFGDVNWRQAETWNLLLSMAVEVLMLRNREIYFTNNRKNFDKTKVSAEVLGTVIGDRSNENLRTTALVCHLLRYSKSEFRFFCL